MDEQLKQYKEKGYIIMDNFLPNEIAEELNIMYVNQKGWEKIDQVREKHYTHVFATKSPLLPKGDEFYMARFDRSRELEKNPRVDEIYKKYFIPQLEKFAGKLKAFDVRCYQLSAGDFYRSHIDDYAGSIGCVFYLNKKWIWDWGGLLQINSYEENDDSIETIFPKFNRVVLIDHEKFKFPHFVSVVSEYAKEPRFSIVSFNG